MGRSRVDEPKRNSRVGRITDLAPAISGGLWGGEIAFSTAAGCQRQRNRITGFCRSGPIFGFCGRLEFAFGHFLAFAKRGDPCAGQNIDPRSGRDCRRIGLRDAGRHFGSAGGRTRRVRRRQHDDQWNTEQRGDRRQGLALEMQKQKILQRSRRYTGSTGQFNLTPRAIQRQLELPRALAVFNPTAESIVLANVTYQIPYEGRLNWVIGAGVGAAEISPNFTDANGVRMSGNGTSFAWQLLAGANWLLDPVLRLQVDYRFRSVLDTNHFYGTTPVQFSNITSHSLMLSIRWVLAAPR